MSKEESHGLILQDDPEQNNGLIDNQKDEEKQPLVVPKTIDSIIDQEGVTFYHVILIIICCLMIACDSISVNLIFLISPIVKQRFNISDFQATVINSMVFLGVIISSSFNGQITLKFKRTKVIILSLLLVYIINLISAFLTNGVLFSVCKFVEGLFIGILISNAPVILCETMPTSCRFLMLNLIYVFYPVGIIYVYAMFYFFFPQVTINDYTYGIVSVCQFYLVTFLLAIFFLDESPRFLIFCGDHEKAFEILNRNLKIVSISEEDKKNIIEDITSNKNNLVKPSLLELFSQKYILLTIILFVLGIINNLVVTGIYSILPKTLSEIEKIYSLATKDQTKRMILLQAIITNLINIPSNILAAYLGETETFGRKYTMVIGYVLSIIFTMLSVFFPLLLYLFIGISLFSVGISFSSLSSYTCEVYPTALRDNAVGFLAGIGRFSGLSSIFIFYALANIGFNVPYVFIVILFVIALIASFLIPFETRGKNLDSF